MTPCQKLLKQEGTARRIESMQQSSTTPSLHLWFLGVAEDCLLVSTVFGTVSSLHLTSFLMIFTLVTLCPEVVQCCLTRTRMYLYVSIIIIIGFYQFTKFEVALCCFTRTTMFTKLFTC